MRTLSGRGAKTEQVREAVLGRREPFSISGSSGLPPTAGTGGVAFPSFLDPQRTLPGCQRLQEDVQPQRQEFPIRVNGENGDLCRRPFRQQPYERTARECFVTVG